MSRARHRPASSLPPGSLLTAQTRSLPSRACATPARISDPSLLLPPPHGSHPMPTASRARNWFPPLMVPTPDGGPFPGCPPHPIPRLVPLLMVPTPEGGPLPSCPSRPAPMLAPPPDANRASPSGTSAPPRLCGRSRHMLRTCWGGEAPSASPAGTSQAPRGKPLVATPRGPRSQRRYHPAALRLGTKMGSKSPGQPPPVPLNPTTVTKPAEPDGWAQVV